MATPPHISIFKDQPAAILPTKGHPTDVGYDLTVISKHKELTADTDLYDTGIKASVENGYYLEIVPRSSLSKSGYMLANSVGIIDPGYTGNLYVALTKVDKFSPRLELPFRCCQLIVRKKVESTLSLVNNFDHISARGVGGFGSTG